MLVEGVMALRAFFDDIADVEPLKPVLPNLMEAIFRLMNEVWLCVLERRGVGS